MVIAITIMVATIALRARPPSRVARWPACLATIGVWLPAAVPSLLLPSVAAALAMQASSPSPTAWCTSSSRKTASSSSRPTGCVHLHLHLHALSRTRTHASPRATSARACLPPACLLPARPPVQLWDWVPNEEAASIALSSTETWECAARLARLARSRWLTRTGGADDTTVLVVRIGLQPA